MSSDSIRFRDVSLTGLACRAGLLALMVVAGVVATGGRAQAMQLTPVQKQEMKLHYERATRAYDVQKYGEAVDEYQKAYEIGGDPAMLYNVAQSYRLNDQLAEALRFYRRYLQRSPNARNREDVERKIADLEKTVEERRKAAAAAATPAPAPAPIVVAPVPVPEPEVRPSGGGGKRVAGIVLAAMGGAGLITAAVTGKIAADKGDELTQASAKGGMQFDPSLESSGKNLDKVAIISVVAGGVLAVTGLVLILTSGSGSGGSPSRNIDQQAFVSPLVGAGIVGGTAVVRF